MIFLDLIDAAGQVIIAQPENHSVPIADLLLSTGFADIVPETALFVITKQVKQRAAGG